MNIRLYRSEDRGKANYGWLDTRYSFSFANYYNPEMMNFGMLRVLNDDIVLPAKGFGTHPHDNMEIITIILEGALEHKDSMGTGDVIHKDEIQVMSAVVVGLPPAPGWIHQDAYEVVFGQATRIVTASLTAFFCGEFANSYVLAKMKVFTEGKFLWTRTIGSTIAGEAVDSIIFYPIAFYGFWPNELLINVMITNYILKVTWEVVATPITYRVVNFLKRKENEDYFDKDTNFTPFSIET